MKKIHMTKKLILSAFAAAVLLLTSSIGVWAYKTPYSYVSLDVNPSIEYTVNRFDRVIDVKAVNDDGQVILEQIDLDDLTNKSIEDAILATVERISTDGYFDGSTDTATDGNTENTQATSVTGSAIIVEQTAQTEAKAVTGSAISIDGGIIITVSNGNDELSEELVEQIREVVEEFVDDNVEIEVSNVGYERVQEAKKLGVTPGKLNLVQKLIASSSDPDSIVLEEWLDKPVKDIMKAIKENKNDSNEDIDLEDDLATSDDLELDEEQEDDKDDDEDQLDEDEDKDEDNEDEDDEDDVDEDEDEDEDNYEDKDEDEDEDKDVNKKVKDKKKEDKKKAEEKAREEREEAKEKAREEREEARDRDTKSQGNGKANNYKNRNGNNN